MDWFAERICALGVSERGAAVKAVERSGKGSPLGPGKWPAGLRLREGLDAAQDV